ncbi:MAG: DUF456 domain-containing protein [Pseudomonadota bacterium]|nr:DUF456 domain-containing protein [Pseudomonadota bacterium]
MPTLEIIGLGLFVVLLLLGLFSIVLGLPGAVFIAAVVLIYATVTGFAVIGWKLLLVIIALAVLAETLEFIVGMHVAAQFGLSLKGFWASLVGSAVGAAALTPFFLGFGAIAGIFLGGLAGLLIVELARRKRLKAAFRASLGMVLGRVAGTCVKGGLAFIMVILALNAIYS